MNIALTDAQARLPELIARAERGEAVTITRDDQAVATLSPVKRPPTDAELDALFKEIEESKRSLPSISTEDILEAIRSGRRM